MLALGDILHTQGCVRHPPRAGRCQRDLVGGCACLEKHQEAGKEKSEHLQLCQWPVFEQLPLTLGIHPLNRGFKE